MNRTKYFLLLTTIFVSMISAKAAGEVDPNFASSIGIVSSGEIRRILEQPDGKILIVGDFSSVDGKACRGIARLNPDTTVDTTFQAPDVGVILSVALQSTGKILVGGPSRKLVRLNPDGSRDNSFLWSNVSDEFSNITSIAVFPDDKFVATEGVVRDTRKYLPNGTIDPSVYINQYAGLYAKAAAIQSNGGLIVATSTILRFQPNGDLDTAFNAGVSGTTEEILIQPDGKILICGSFTQFNGTPVKNVIRLNPNGSIDSTFAGNFDGANAAVNGVAISQTGRIALSGNFTTYNGASKIKVAILNSDGSLDTSFSNSTVSFSGNDAAFLQNGNLLVAGKNAFTSVYDQNFLFSTNLNGNVVSSRNVAGLRTGFKIANQPDGKFIVGGLFNSANNVTRQGVVRFNRDGTLDPTFNTNFTSGANAEIRSIEIQNDGKIIVAGVGFVGRRFNSDGTVDSTTVGVENSTYEVKSLSDGKILLGGGILNFNGYLVRYNSNLTRDTSFSVSVNGAILSIEVQPDGKLLIGGEFTTVNGVARGRIARLNADGTLDTTFNPFGGGNFAVHDISLYPDGKIMVGGNFTSFAFSPSYSRMVRLNSDGSVDPSFVPVVNSTVRSLKLESGGKILIGGVFTTIDGLPRRGLARLNPNGTSDVAFNSGIGTDGDVYSIETQTDGKIIYSGNIGGTNGRATAGIGRLLNNQTKQFDFDGDGKADIALYRPSTNFWYRLDSSNGQFSERNFGIAVDLLSPADYDNDGKTDLSIFRPTTGTWWYRDLTSGNFFATQWGASGDLPVPSDFDGDGKADRVVFRPSNGGWYRLKSSNGQFDSTQFGQLGDVPLIADFDGDGKSDIAVFRPSNGTWYWLESSTGQFRGFQFGQNGDLAVPADYDGDGKTEFAVFRQSSGDWFFINSSTVLFRHFNFGVSGDKPVAADYDGDGKADIAVFRPSVGTWYLQRSQLGFTSVQFGSAGDIPIPGAFVR